MRKTLTTAALLLALSCPAFAGEMHTPPAPSSGTIHTGSPAQSDGTMHTGEPAATAEGEIPNDLTQIALELLAVLPSLL